jgi:hypothetical protein
LTIGGVFQNPAFILLTFLEPSLFEGFDLTNYITAGLIIYSAALGLSSVVKLSSEITLYQFTYFTELDSDHLNMLLAKIVGIYWLPEFIYYVLPSVGTMAYFLSMN